MKIAASRAAEFAARPDDRLKVILVYGPDEGLVDARLAQIAAHFAPDLNDPFRVGRLDGATLRREPGRFWDEVMARSLGGGRRLVVVRDVPEALAAEVERYLAADETPTDTPAMLLLAGQDLPPRAKLRALCEASPAAASVPCYALDGEDLRRFVRDRLARQNVTIDRAGIAYLAYALAGDHRLREGELEKLALYAGPGGNLTHADVLACVGDTGDTTLAALALSVAGGDLPATDRQVSRVLADGMTPVGVIRAVQDHFARLYRAALVVATGQGAEQAMAALRPPVFWKHKKPFAAQVTRWSPVALTQAIDRLVDTETALKTTGYPAPQLLRFELLAVAGFGRRQASGRKQ